MKIIIKRTDEYKEVSKYDKDGNKIGKDEGSTIGVLTLYNDKGESLFTCFTLENSGPSTNESGKDRRILPGEYGLKWTFSTTNGSLSKYHEYWKKSKHVQKVSDGTKGPYLALGLTSKVLPKFESRRILLHVGNYPQDSLGCILLGMINPCDGTIRGSVNAVKYLFEQLEEVDLNKIKVYIEEKD